MHHPIDDDMSLFEPAVRRFNSIVVDEVGLLLIRSKPWCERSVGMPEFGGKADSGGLGTPLTPQLQVAQGCPHCTYTALLQYRKTLALTLDR